MPIRLKLFVKKPIYVPTLAGWLLLLAVMVGLSFLCVHGVYPFLAYERTIDADVFITEGWVPDHTLDQSLPMFTAGPDRLVIATGGPIGVGSHLSQYKSYAELTAATLVKLGVKEDQIVAVPYPAVKRGRTYAAALAVRQWLQKNPHVKRANLVTTGPHARRSLLTFKKVLPRTFELGVCVIAPQDYDPQRWWTYSEGCRTVVSEAIAYAYARLIGVR
ncbi:MAG TPA: ElyC/SanA/YdcF family protein [Sedimentisphaerales bacterium]|nr:ElyC/SanA/YdcF family protein [Sedimentisphaerales bacterium]HRS10280.1 ElyC/SanA/YdcF family protein [Sedimentisphaerales bacterium]HRV46986.1 ElyC/SanA/YdcF family protein [Sedimentisphaerales bacterium]